MPGEKGGQGDRENWMGQPGVKVLIRSAISQNPGAQAAPTGQPCPDFTSPGFLLTR